MAQIRGQVIAIAITKGRVGKSTLAGNLAWALAMQTGRRVLLVDADPQASVTKWFDLATAELPFDHTQLTTAGVLQQQLPRLRQAYDLVVDWPPMQTDVTAAAVTQADLGLVPMLPSPLDVLAYTEIVWRKEGKMLLFDLVGVPGFSGSPVVLFDTREVIGVVYGPGPTACGFGFEWATPIIYSDYEKALSANTGQ
jgi:cellulose biosynthesis protein BcsQ